MSHGVALIEAGADVSCSKAGFDPLPFEGAVHAAAQPPGVVFQAVLQVAPAGGEVAGAAVGDHVDEDDEDGEEADEDEHGDEVGEEEPRDAEEGAGEARDGGEQEEDAEDDDRPLEELDAGVVGEGGEPGADADDGDGEEHGKEVDAGDHVAC